MKFWPGTCPNCGSNEQLASVDVVACSALLFYDEETGEMEYTSTTEVHWDGQENIDERPNAMQIQCDGCHSQFTAWTDHPRLSKERRLALSNIRRCDADAGVPDDFRGHEEYNSACQLLDAIVKYREADRNDSFVMLHRTRWRAAQKKAHGGGHHGNR